MFILSEIQLEGISYGFLLQMINIIYVITFRKCTFSDRKTATDFDLPKVKFKNPLFGSNYM